MRIHLGVDYHPTELPGRKKKGGGGKRREEEGGGERREMEGRRRREEWNGRKEEEEERRGRRREWKEGKGRKKKGGGLKGRNVKRGRGSFFFTLTVIDRTSSCRDCIALISHPRQERGREILTLAPFAVSPPSQVDPSVFQGEESIS